MSDDAQSPKPDLLFVHSPTETGDGFRVIRAREESIELAEVRPLSDGQAIEGDLVRLKQRPEHERLFDVETVLAREASAPRSGPPRVSSEAYRDNWEAVFGPANKPSLLN